MRIRMLGIGVLMAIVLVPIAPATAGTEASCPDKVAPSGHGWTTIDSPDFALSPMPSGFQSEDTKRINFFAVDPVDPNRIFIGNYFSILRTDDGGCTWKRIFGVPTPPEAPSQLCDQVPLPTSLIANGCGRIISIDIGPTESPVSRSKRCVNWPTRTAP